MINKSTWTRRFVPEKRVCWLQKPISFCSSHTNAKSEQYIKRTRGQKESERENETQCVLFRSLLYYGCLHHCFTITSIATLISFLLLSSVPLPTLPLLFFWVVVAAFFSLVLSLNIFCRSPLFCLWKNILPVFPWLYYLLYDATRWYTAAFVYIYTFDSSDEGGSEQSSLELRIILLLCDF